MMWNSAGGSKVAAYLHTNVVSYKDNVALFQQAEKEFGGVDVSIREETCCSNDNIHVHYFQIVHLNAGIIGGSKIAFTPLYGKQSILYNSSITLAYNKVLLSR